MAPPWQTINLDQSPAVRLKPIPLLIFSSRWLQLPLYVGLIVAQCVYVILFLKELWHLVVHSWEFGEQQIMLVVLGLIDVVMISNLLVMVIVGGYETFVSRLKLETHPDNPEWLSHVNSGILKVKLAMAIIGISSIHLLRTFIEAGMIGHADGTGHRDRGDVADDHPHGLHRLGDRDRLGRPAHPPAQLRLRIPAFAGPGGRLGEGDARPPAPLCRAARPAHRARR